jgi:hypothetical protein
MASLLSDSEKLSYSQVFNDIHDTFARKITMWKTPKRVVVSTNNNFNFLYAEQNSIESTYIPVSGVFDARVQWGNPAKLMNDQDIKEEIPGNICRIKVKQDAIDFLADAAQVEIDGRKVEKIGSSKPHGLFNIDYYTVFFKESN